MKTLSKEDLKKALLEKWKPITGTHHIPFCIERVSDCKMLYLNKLKAKLLFN